MMLLFFPCLILFMITGKIGFLKLILFLILIAIFGHALGEFYTLFLAKKK